MRLTFRAILAAVLLLSAIALLVKPDGELPMEAPDSLVYILTAEPATLDPRRISDETPIPVLINVYEGLLRFKPGSSEVEPAIASKYEISGDGRRWTFQIRENLRFHDGTPLDANSVKSCIEQQLNAGSELYPYAGIIYEPIEKAETKDDLTLVLQLRYPYAPLSQNLAMPAAAIVKSGSEPDRPVGSGPYRIAEANAEMVLLEAFPEYRTGAPRTEHIIFKTITEPKARLKALNDRKADVAEGLGMVDTIGSRQLETVELGALDLSYLAFYTNRKPFDNLQLRQAAAYAIDRNAIIRELYPGEVVPARTHLPPGVLGHTSKTKMTFNPEEAKQLLTEEAYDGTEITLITYHGTRPYNPAGGLALADAVAVQLEKVGFKVKITAYDWEECKEAIKNQDGDAFLFGWISENGDPDDFLYNLLSTPQIANGMNGARYSNAHVDALLTRARQVSNRETRAHLYEQAQEIIIDDIPWVVLNHSIHSAAYRPEIHGLILQPTGGFYLADVYKK
ncbi:MAG: ABC transporter substrate-binding protein [Firmicutes bacterium]|nr:ABC transporter substrate-binding protein [Bacillota bacterium]MBU4532500.1 ABC transporter substrate-binding protein [Bacillota bacterium]MBV1728062.1 ABC transporter substrate-binding protein [Desulforudis sp.]MBV1735071.1 ABC transporter substrate-binding protein [Desulforudis sp.]MBV1769837.1 ABC transporter substrate-binding protein [Desulforudis sp.]